jgi:hypothetical protein
MLIVGIAIKRMKNADKFAKWFLILFCMLTMGMNFYYRMTYVFWEDGIQTQIECITKGPDAGLLVSSKQYQYYNAIYDDTEEIRNMEADTNVLYISDKSLWLAGNQRCASYSPLCNSISEKPELLYEYYEEHPEKKADVIYCDKTYSEEFVNELSGKFNMKIKEGKSGYILTRN